MRDSPSEQPRPSADPKGLKILLFGASGMLGHGVLRACLADPAVREVVSVVRREGAVVDPKLRETKRARMDDFNDLREDWRDVDACFFCLGVSAAGLDEAAYRAITYEITLAAARVLAQAHPGACFVYVSGAGTDSSAAGRSMWARIKGATENAVLALPLDAYMFRPGLIQASHGEVSQTRFYRLAYAVVGPLLPWLGRYWPNAMTSTARIGAAMLALARDGGSQRILRTAQINALAEAPLGH